VPETKRLSLRQWKEEDLADFYALNADSEVMRYFPETLDRATSDDMAASFGTLISERGWGFWATEIKSTGEFIGFVGLNIPRTTLPFSPCVEIGWRLAKAYWGKGYATEAAQESLKYAFDELDLAEVVSFTTVQNSRSRAVMERLGLADTGDNFIYPDISKDHPLAEHVLYKIEKKHWQAK